MKKRFCSIGLALVLFFCNILTVDAKYYEDVQSLDGEYQDAVNYVSDNGYMVGTLPSTFVPFEEMTRAMVVTVLHNMEDKVVCDIEIPFADVSPGMWYYNAVRWAYANSIVSGKTETCFDPNAKITRAEFAIILRKYAKMEGYSTEITNETDIMGVSDYASIPSYAQKAMQWMVDKRIYRIDSSASKLNPNSGLERKDAALYITRYGEFVEGLDFESDTLSFINRSSNFTNASIGAYYINEDDWKDLEEKVRGACALLEADKKVNADALVNYLNDRRNESKTVWGGSCYGMAMVVALDKIGKIGFNENLADAVDSISKVPIPINQLEVLSRINYYQLSQHIPQIQDRPFAFGKKNEEPLAVGYEKLLEEIKTNGIVQLSYYWPKENGVGSNGHCVIAYRYLVNGDGDYELWTYNPNSTSVYKYIIDDQYKWSSFDSLGVTHIRFRSDLSVFDLCDYDGEYNDIDYDQTEEYLGTAAIIVVPLSQGNFTLTNAAGKKVCYDSGMITFTGDMEIIDYQLTTDTLMLYVEDSKSFLVEVDDEVCQLSVLGQEIYADIDGSNIERVIVNSDGTVQLVGDVMEYSVAVDLCKDEIEPLEISDVASGVVTISENE